MYYNVILITKANKNRSRFTANIVKIHLRNLIFHICMTINFIRHLCQFKRLFFPRVKQRDNFLYTFAISIKEI